MAEMRTLGKIMKITVSDVEKEQPVQALPDGRPIMFPDGNDHGGPLAKLSISVAEMTRKDSRA